MTEVLLPTVLYTTIIDRLIPVAGNGNVDQIHVAMGSLLLDRPGLADRLAGLAPCPVTGRMTDNEITIALGEHGDICPSGIRGHIMVADLEEELSPHCRSKTSDINTTHSDSQQPFCETKVVDQPGMTLPAYSSFSYVCRPLIAEYSISAGSFAAEPIPRTGGPALGRV
ncbi:hypothetical protein [Bradyrhizobium mercantei]|uniref:hypothetical protein n=1 Tax=Bradyrhizobium mercantei TaxID=1904807 RepID=UPI0011787C0B|nr:hypothetical protein [Bradyrhizobium mercantei]